MPKLEVPEGALPAHVVASATASKKKFGLFRGSRYDKAITEGKSWRWNQRFNTVPLCGGVGAYAWAIRRKSMPAL